MAALGQITPLIFRLHSAYSPRFSAELTPSVLYWMA